VSDIIEIARLHKNARETVIINLQPFKGQPCLAQPTTPATGSCEWREPRANREAIGLAVQSADMLTGWERRFVYGVREP